ncbi:GATA zinc finger domain-containing protein 14-like isoform X2 [Zerene cesonia]|uniref:GATA zinc finger domain-containing protein 14-like isoform X2 n=1 Tax=Zerene cesonia TaxID=33412 RepID=UPI0018E59E7B|nr:GATA zinc finger domain-containing protein 14-like isoform X2 [Zerene cesonia]
MWKFIIFVCCIPLVTSQFNQQRDHDQSWNIKLAVPGAPGGDYPTLNTIPRTSFTCAGKAPGYYADQEANCQVFKVCTAGSTYGFQSFLCPNGTLFNQAVFVCDWWMNVNCGKSQELINKNQRFGKIQLGPQLIQDVKKMITHPMRNPYNSGFFRNNLVVMQEYKPPTEQFYPNGAIISNQNKNTKNVYVPYKSLYRDLQSSIENTNDINFAASTTAPQYITNLNSIQNTPTKQYIDYQRSQNANINSFQSSRNGYLIQGQKEPTTQLNFQKFQTQKTNQVQYNYNRNIPIKLQDHTFNKIAQGNPPNQQIIQPPRFHNNNGVDTKPKTKQNSDLVFSFLADSLNAAKEYSNIAKQNIQSSTNTPPNNFRNSDDQRFSNKISQLTSSQFATNNNVRNKNVQQFSPQPQDISRIKESSQFNNNRQQHGFQQPKLQQITTPSQPFTQNQQQAARIQDSRNKLQNVQNQNHIYSGQLYQHPVPEVTRDYYNTPNNQLKQLKDFEIIPSRQIPFSYQQNSYNQESSSEHNSIQTKELNNLIRSGNGITAQLQDSIVGTLPHPIESDKLLTYKKDQSYYIFSQLNNNDHENNRINSEKSNDKSNAALQIIPSVAFKVNDVNEQHKFLKTFKINDFGVPQGAVDGYRNPNQRQDISTDVDFTVSHPNFGDKINEVDTYNGPSSYNAPQTLYNYERPQQLMDNNQNSKIENLDSNEPNGYPKTSPLRKFNT